MTGMTGDRLGAECLSSTAPTPRHCTAGINTFFGRAAALISATNNVANIAKARPEL
jgi:hypothetical protein